MNMDKLEAVFIWIDARLSRGEIETIEVTNKCLELNVYDDKEKYQAMIDGLQQKSRNFIKKRMRFLGRTFAGSKGTENKRAYKRDRDFTSEEMQERKNYWHRYGTHARGQEAYWAYLHKACFGKQLSLSFKLTAEEKAIIEEWVAHGMQ